jgi:hypothetical protein
MPKKNLSGKFNNVSDLHLTASFEAKLKGSDLNALVKKLDFTQKRTDDWDLEIGGKNIGKSGWITLYKTGVENIYLLVGFTQDKKSEKTLETKFQECLKEIKGIGAKSLASTKNRIKRRP